MKTKTLIPLGARGVLIAGVAVAIFATMVMFAYADVAPTVTTTIRNSSNAVVTSAPIGSSVQASVTVASSSATTSPTGTVTFNRYENLSCSGTPTTQVGVALVNGMASSSLFAVPATGLSYKTHYNGQAGVYSEADSACQSVSPIGSSTTLTTTLSTTSVAAGSTVNETATLSGATSNASGTVSYVVYSDNSCSTSWLGAGVRTVTNAIVPASDSVAFNFPGTYYWKAVYSGDANNTAATSSCLTLSVLATSTPTTTSTISGQVYNDLDKDGVKDGGEGGVAGFTIKLYKGAGWWKNGSAFMTAVSDSNGNYSFTNLANGTYSIELINMNPWKQNSGDYKSVVIANQVSQTNKDFAVWNKYGTTTPPTGTTTSATISGKVYNDLDGDEKLDGNEPGLSGFTVNLYNSHDANKHKGYKTPFKTTVTDSNGNYSFANLANGKYSVELINKSGWHQDTGDYHKLNIKKGVGFSNIDFANSSSTSSGHDDDDEDEDHDDDNDKGKGKGKGNNNGNHWGWRNFVERFGGWPWGNR